MSSEGRLDPHFIRADLFLNPLYAPLEKFRGGVQDSRYPITASAKAIVKMFSGYDAIIKNHSGLVAVSVDHIRRWETVFSVELGFPVISRGQDLRDGEIDVSWSVDRHFEVKVNGRSVILPSRITLQVDWAEMVLKKWNPNETITLLEETFKLLEEDLPASEFALSRTSGTEVFDADLEYQVDMMRDELLSQ